MSGTVTEANSYGQILRSSSIIGGAQGINYLVSLARIKIIAVLLGPAGVGLISLYQSAVNLLSTASSLGINSSGTREVAKAHGESDVERTARTVRILRRACWITGFLGWGLAAVLSRPISHWAFGSDEHALDIKILGAALLLSSISGGQMALIQGVRRIGDLARASMYGMLASTVIAIALYAWLREGGIVPVLLTNAAVTLFVTWRFARKVPLIPVEVSWRETLIVSRQLLGLGVAFMWAALLSAGLDLFTRSLITREYGIDVAGHYHAAWALSGMFAAFVLQAMGADFYPRLTGLINDRPQAVQLVNEQTEIGVLLVLPGLLATLAFAPLLIRLFYTAEFAPAAVLLPWFLLGVFGQVISYPLGFIQLAKGAGRWFIATESSFRILQLALVVWLVPTVGPIGAAYAFVGSYAVYTLIMRWVGAVLIGFRWSAAVYRLLLLSGVALFAGLLTPLFIDGWPATVIGTAIMVAGSIACFRGLATRLGPEHRLVRGVLRTPGIAWLFDARSA